MKPLPVIKAYRVHPETGEDANAINTAGLTVEQKEEIARAVRHGARFYWFRGPNDKEPWARIERANYAFVADMIGQRVEWID
jgi:hypothetical protein